MLDVKKSYGNLEYLIKNTRLNLYKVFEEFFEKKIKRGFFEKILKLTLKEPLKELKECFYF